MNEADKKEADKKASDKKEAGRGKADKQQSDRLAKADALMHPVRLRLMMALAGREMTTQQLADKLPDVAKASLYRHIRQLCEAGAVRAVRETPIRGALEKVYAMQMEAARLSPQEVADIGVEEHARYFSAFIASLLAQFQSFAQGADGDDLVAKGMAYSMAPLYLTDAEYGQVVAAIQAALNPSLANAPDGARRRRLISIIVLPDDAAEEAGGNAAESAAG